MQINAGTKHGAIIEESGAMTNVKSLKRRGSGSLISGVLGLGDFLSGTDASVQPGVTSLQHFFECFLRGIPLTDAMFEVRHLRDEAGFGVVPKDVDVVMRGVHRYDSQINARCGVRQIQGE
tara:strand:+ start:140 stop:502 length:363 start_codon:yes stop_codon:yes gene_type:complete